MAKAAARLCLVGAMLCSVGSLEPLAPAGRGACVPLPPAPRRAPAPHGAAEGSTRLGAVRVRVLLALRGGGARNKWKRKQNQNRAAGGGYGGGGGGGRGRERAGRGRHGGGAGSQGGGEAASFQTRWQNFARSAGGRRPHGAVSEESFMSSQDVDSEGNEYVYVDGQESYSGMDMGDSESGDYIYVDEVCACSLCRHCLRCRCCCSLTRLCRYAARQSRRRARWRTPANPSAW
jgi:hypothetical protein